MRSSPGSLRPVRRPRWRASSPASSATARMPFVLRDFGVVRAKSVIRAAVFAARCPPSLSPVRGGKHGVSDPTARAPRGPARVRRGRSRHDCLCRCRLLSTACSAAKSAACFTASYVLRCDPDLPDDPVPVRPENDARKQVTFGACLPASSVVKNGDSRSCIRRGLAAVVTWSHLASRQRRRPSRQRCCICARHRARRSASLRPRMRAAFGP
jgi:hypothetical protein